MDRARVYTTLNDLLAAEQAAVLPRLTECTAYIAPDEVDGLEGVGRMAAEQQANVARLAQVLIDLGGQPEPHTRNRHTADFHYVDLDVLLPRVIADERALAARYQGAQAAASDYPSAAAVVADLAAWHRVCAGFLARLVRNTV